MSQRVGRLAWTIVLLTVGMTGCVMIPKNEYPPGWPAPVTGDSAACPKLSGTYGDWPARPTATGQEPSLDTFSLAKLLTQNRLDFDSGLGKVRLETMDDGTLRVDILENRTNALILSKSLRLGEDLLCEDGALVFGPFAEASGELFLMLSPNVGWRNVELRVTVEGDMIAVINDHAVAAIGVLLPVFAMERYWYRWSRLHQKPTEEGRPSQPHSNRPAEQRRRLAFPQSISGSRLAFRQAHRLFDRRQSRGLGARREAGEPHGFDKSAGARRH